MGDMERTRTEGAFYQIFRDLWVATTRSLSLSGKWSRYPFLPDQTTGLKRTQSLPPGGEAGLFFNISHSA